MVTAYLAQEMQKKIKNGSEKTVMKHLFINMLFLSNANKHVREP